jgi:hypothetical protein
MIWQCCCQALCFQAHISPTQDNHVYVFPSYILTDATQRLMEQPDSG